MTLLKTVAFLLLAGLAIVFGLVVLGLAFSFQWLARQLAGVADSVQEAIYWLDRQTD